MWLHSQPVNLGSAVSTAGTFTMSAVIPAATTPGAHSIVVNYGGVTMTARITVTAAGGAQVAADGVSGLQRTGLTTPVLTIVGIGLLLILAGIMAMRARVRRVTK